MEDPNKISSPLVECVKSGTQRVYTEKENCILLSLTVKWITSAEALKTLWTEATLTGFMMICVALP